MSVPAKKTSTVKIPECCKVSVSVYVRSDSAGNGGKIDVGGRVSPDLFKDANFEAFITMACKALNAALDVTDSRPMTTAEVRAWDEDQGAERIEYSERVQ